MPVDPLWFAILSKKPELLLLDEIETKVVFHCYSSNSSTLVVTLDGTLIRKSGIMTGGLSMSMAGKAQHWDAKYVNGKFVRVLLASS